MQALSSYNSDHHSQIQAALQAVNSPTTGLTARSYFSERGTFAEFIWPDWPESLSKDLAGKVELLQRAQPQLHRVEPGSPDWEAVYRGWRTDRESAAVIATAFTKPEHFGSRLLWVESEKDQKGTIEGRCMIATLPEQPNRPPSAFERYIGSPDSTGEVALHLSWRDSQAVPLFNLSQSDLAAFQSSAREVFDWARRRIQTVLDALYERLKKLYGDRFRGLYVFGSYARPDAGIELSEDSDLDVALLLSDFESVYAEIERFGHVTFELGFEHGLVISLVPVREADFKEGRTDFTRVISSYAVPVK